MAGYHLLHAYNLIVLQVPETVYQIHAHTHPPSKQQASTYSELGNNRYAADLWCLLVSAICTDTLATDHSNWLFFISHRRLTLLAPPYSKHVPLPIYETPHRRGV